MNQKKRRDQLIIILSGIVIGALYPLLNRSDSHSSVAIFNGLVIGLSGAFFISWLEISWNPVVFRRLSFLRLIFLKTTIYTSFFAVLVPVVISMNRALHYHDGFTKYFNDGGLSHFLFKEDYGVIMLYALTATAMFLFTYQMSRKLGQGMLWGTISGKYHKPREAELVFLFLDLKNSTPIAERIGDIAFSNLLKDVFFDITDSIVSNYGKIYRYVGDEVVVYWPNNKNFKNLNFVGTFFSAQKMLESRKSYYQKKYGVKPEVKAGFHVGKIVSGDIGEIKSQICFLGNVMVETSAIEKCCKLYNTSVLVSDELFNIIQLPEGYVTKKEGVLKGEGERVIELISVSEKR